MSRLSGTAPNGLRAQAMKGPAPLRQGRALRLDVGAFSVRPYTLRKGDTLESIAEKRGFEVKQLKKLNHDIKTSELVEGTTIVVPSGALSDRDKEIIQGIGWRYRTYPVRGGENIDAITSKRGISTAEIERLNPDVDVKKLKKNQVLKLPAGKYTVREREMLTGVAGVPNEFFQSKGFTVSASVFAVVAVVGVVTWWKGRDSD